jgi:hypothetical protein
MALLDMSYLFSPCSWALGQMSLIVMEREEQKRLRKVARRGVTEAMIDEMDVSGNGEVDKTEFLCYMLVSAFVSHRLVSRLAPTPFESGAVYANANAVLMPAVALSSLHLHNCISLILYCRSSLASANRRMSSHSSPFLIDWTPMAPAKLTRVIL